MKNKALRNAFHLTPFIFMLATSLSLADLVVGTAGGPFGRGKVYWGDGNGKWVNLSEGTDLGAAIMTTVFYDGTIYVGTQTRPGYGGLGGSGQVWRYEGGTTWTNVGNLDSSVMTLAVMDGTLYAGTSASRLYKYGGAPGNWSMVGQVSYPAFCTGFRASVVSAVSGVNQLHLGELDRDTFWKYDPAGGLRLVANYGRSCVYAMEEFQGQLYAGCWHGSFYQSADGKSFAALAAPYADHIWAMETFQGKLFVGEGEGNSDKQAALRCGDGATMTTVKTFPVTGYSEGVSAMVADAKKLYVGTGVPDGYFCGDGIAEVWAYDGASFAKICPADFFGGGVQSMAVGSFQPKLEVLSVKINPGKVCCGSSALVSVETKGSFVDTKEEDLKLSLPEGWTMQPITGPQYGNGVFVAAVVVPCHQTGTFTISAVVAGTTWNGTALTSSNSVTASVEAIRSVPDADLAKHTAVQEAILQTRAWDLNLENPTFSARIPKILDLTSAGWPMKEVSTTSAGTFGYAYSESQSSTSYPDAAYTRCYNTAGWSAYAIIYDNTFTMTGTTNSFRQRWKSRPWFRFQTTTPEAALSVKKSSLAFKTDYASSSALYTFNLNSIAMDPMSGGDAQLLYADCGNDTLKSGVQLSRYTTFACEVPPTLSNVLNAAFDLTEASAPYWSYSYSYDGSCSYRTASGAWVQTPYGNWTIQTRFASISLLGWQSLPSLSDTYLCGYLPEETLRMCLNYIAANDVVNATVLAGVLNAQYGSNPDQLGIRARCELHDPTSPPSSDSIPAPAPSTEAAPAPAPAPSPAPAPDYSTVLVMGKTSLDLIGSGTVYGSVHSDSALTIGGNTYVAGRASYLGKLTLNGSKLTIVRGSSQVATRLFPTQAQVLTAAGKYKTIEVPKDKKKKPLPLIITASTASKYSGVLLVKGNVKITGNVTLTATIVATGNISIEGKSAITSAGGGWALFTEKGSVSVAGTTSIKGKVAGNKVGINAGASSAFDK